MAGFSDYGIQAMLGELLPNGTDVYVALLTTLPTAYDGTGLVECSGSGYARKAHQAWVTSVRTRYNNGAIEFAALSGSLDDVLGWAIYDAAVAGNLLAYGSIKDAGGNAVSLSFIATDQPRFVDNELVVGWQVA